MKTPIPVNSEVYVSLPLLSDDLHGIIQTYYPLSDEYDVLLDCKCRFLRVDSYKITLIDL